MGGTDFQAFHFISDDGLSLYGRNYANGVVKSLPVICLAGLSRNSRDFHQLALRLSHDGYRAVTLDYRGRGESSWDDNKTNYNVAREAQDVIAALDHLQIERAIFIGTSRGGLILHVLAATHIERIAAGVLNDIGPVVKTEGLQRIRDYLSNRREFESLGDVAAALKAIHAGEFPVFDEADWRDMAEALYRESNGSWMPDFDPALVEPLKAADLSKPLPALWEQYQLLAARPLLVVRGENSALLSEDTVQEMLARRPEVHTLIADGQGHAPVLHKEPVGTALAAFLNGVR